MIKNRKIFENFNREYVKVKRYAYSQRIRLYESLLKEAQQLKKMPLKNPLEGLDACIRVAKILNSAKR